MAKLDGRDRQQAVAKYNDIAEKFVRAIESGEVLISDLRPDAVAKLRSIFSLRERA